MPLNVNDDARVLAPWGHLLDTADSYLAGLAVEAGVGLDVYVILRNSSPKNDMSSLTHPLVIY